MLIVSLVGVCAGMSRSHAAGRLDLALATPEPDSLTAPTLGVSAAPEPFGALAAAAPRSGLEKKWRGVARKLPDEHEILVTCRTTPDRCPSPARKFVAVLDRAQGREGWARIAEINRSINLDIHPVDDLHHYGVIDYWATPLKTFSSNAGDCEDYAIAKYVALREIGIASQDLRLVIVHDRAAGEDHAVTAVRHDGHWLILDNRSLEMRRDEDVAEFEPLFVIDRRGVWRVAATTPRPAIASHPPTGAQVAAGWQAAPLLL